MDAACHKGREEHNELQWERLQQIQAWGPNNHINIKQNASTVEGRFFSFSTQAIKL